MTTLEILKAARELLSDEKRWTQHAFAKEADGKSCDYDSPAAVCWCAAGAIGKVYGGDTLTDRAMEAQALLAGSDVLHELGEESSVTNLNDSGTHAEVLALFDRAIEKEGERR